MKSSKKYEKQPCFRKFCENMTSFHVLESSVKIWKVLRNMKSYHVLESSVKIWKATMFQKVLWKWSRPHLLHIYMFNSKTCPFSRNESCKIVQIETKLSEIQKNLLIHLVITVMMFPKMMMAMIVINVSWCNLCNNSTLCTTIV